MKTPLLAAAALSGAAFLISTPLWGANVPVSASSPGDAVAADDAVTGVTLIQPAAFGDPPGSRHRRVKKARESKSSQTVQPQQPEPQGETGEQHRQYLQHYGF